MTQDNHDLNEADSKIVEALDTICKLDSSYFTTLANSISIVVERIKEVVTQIHWETVSQSLKSISKLLESLVNPQISQEEVERRKAAYRAWGSYGWAMPESAPYDLFNNPPKDQKEANHIAMQYCRKQDIEQVFYNLEKIKHIRKKDLEEAKFCFDNRKYKACSMILFSMIDARLIRLVNKQEKKQRPSGNAAAKQLIDYIQKEYNDAQRLYFVLQLENLRGCYECIFAHGKDFHNQVPNINRNYVEHGMRWKPINRTECIQVLLLYYETMSLFEQLKVKRMPLSSR